MSERLTGFIRTITDKRSTSIFLPTASHLREQWNFEAAGVQSGGKKRDFVSAKGGPQPEAALDRDDPARVFRTRCNQKAHTQQNGI